MISIIIPTFNSEIYLCETLESVKMQTSDAWQCIIVDDGSIDATSTIVKSFLSDERFSYMKRDRLPKGANTCRNIGAFNANGKYLLFLDSDDLLDPTCVENRLKSIAGNNESIAVFNVAILGDTTKKTINKVSLIEGDSYLNMFVRLDLPWSNPAVLWDASFFKKIGGYDESFPRLQDPELYTRALLSDNVSLHYYKESYPDVYYRSQFDLKITDKTFYEKVVVSHLMYIKKFSQEILNTRNLSSSEKNELILELRKLMLKSIFKYFFDKKFKNHSLMNRFLNAGVRNSYITFFQSSIIKFAYRLSQHSSLNQKAKNIYFLIFLKQLN